MPLIAPSILSADFARLGEEVAALEKAGADWIHFDVMDGHFVPNITVGPMVLRAVRRHTTLPIDVHLMIEQPDAYVEDFARAGADAISIHVEACRHLHRSLQLLRHLRVKVGVALNPHTPVSAIQPVLEEIDFVLVMTVNPGFGGQKFIPSSFRKVGELVALRQQEGLDFNVEVDGGVKTENLRELGQAGVDIFVMGSAIFESADYARTFARIRDALSDLSRPPLS